MQALPTTPLPPSHLFQTSPHPALLEEEARVEKQFAELRAKSADESDLRSFKGVMHTGLLNTALSCGTGIKGCYAPNGAHAEKPVEIGLRSDGTVLSLYEVAGLEIWLDVMYDAQDMTGMGNNPKQDASFGAALYFVMFILVSVFRVLNLLVARSVAPAWSRAS